MHVIAISNAFASTDTAHSIACSVVIFSSLPHCHL